MEFTRQQQEIREWLERRRAIMLAHNYQPAPIQDVADLVGDSLELSLAAAKTGAEVIVFCGVHFMAETAAILCPDKTVLLPRLDLGCCLAESVKVDQLTARKEELPGVPVVTYVNSRLSRPVLSSGRKIVAPRFETFATQTEQSEQTGVLALAK